MDTLMVFMLGIMESGFWSIYSEEPFSPQSIVVFKTF